MVKGLNLGKLPGEKENRSQKVSESGLKTWAFTRCLFLNVNFSSLILLIAENGIQIVQRIHLSYKLSKGKTSSYCRQRL